MTKNQKAFQHWLAKIAATCINNGADHCPLDWNWHHWTLQTKFGQLHISCHESDYDSQTKRGFTSIYLRFDDPIKVTSHIPKIEGDFNRFSGKWNIHFSGDKKDIEEIRRLSLWRLEKRLKWATEDLTEHFPHDVCPKCGSPSIPAEKVPDQTLRGCPKCKDTFTEDLDRPASIAAMVENNF